MKKSSLFTRASQSLMWKNAYLQRLLHQPLHIPCNLLVGDLGIDLRAGNRRMLHHLSDALDRHTSL